MVKKCCLVPCKTHYDPKKGSIRDNGQKISVYRFPPESEPENRQKWIEVCKKVREDLKVGAETVICSRHWPENFPTYTKKGRIRPAVPPSIFPDVPSSILPTPLPPPRETTRTSNQVRNTLPDELDHFEQLDRFDYSQLLDELVVNESRKLPIETTAFVNDGCIFIQSVSYFHGIPTFLLAISGALKFETFHLGVKIHIPSLTKNRVTRIERWSVLEEAIRYLNSKETTSKMEVLKEQVAALSVVPVGQILYNPDIMVRAFEYFSTSRALYNRIREDFQLPSVRTLT